MVFVMRSFSSREGHVNPSWRTRPIGYLMVSVVAVACSCSKAEQDATVLMRSRLVDSSGVGVPGLSISVAPEFSGPGLHTSPWVAKGTSDPHGSFVAAAVSAGDMQGASIGKPLTFAVFVFSNEGGGKWTCHFARVPRALPEGRIVSWEGPLPSLVLRSDGSCDQ